MAPARRRPETMLDEIIKQMGMRIDALLARIFDFTGRKLDASTLYVMRTGETPTPRDVCEAVCRMALALGVPCDLDALAKAMRADEYRGPGNPNFVKKEPAPLHAVGALEFEDRGQLYEVPVYGYIAAGPATDEALEEVDTMTVVKADAKLKFLRVRGRSMTERGVEDGDDLKVEERPARDGEVGLVDVDGRLMLATVRLKNGKLAKLEKAAPGFKDIAIRRGMQVTVRWVVLEIIKRQRPHPAPRARS